MKLSIIVPVYHMAGEGKLNDCMDSLIHQEGLADDYEIIAVDDASPDDSFRILQEYEANFPGKVRAVRSPENRKQGGARNIGLSLAKGEWIGFMDADDWAAPDMYAKLLRRAEETGADVVGCQYHITGERSMRIGKIIVNNTPEQTGVLNTERYRKLVLKPGSMVIKIYQKSVIDKFALRFPEHMFYEDNAAAPLWLLRFRHFELVDEPLYYYYQHETSTVHTITEERCRNRMDTAELMIRECREQGFFETYKPELEARFTQIYYVNTLFSYMAGIRLPKLSFLKELKRGMQEWFPAFRDNPYYPQMYDEEQRRLIDYHMKNVLFYLVYDRLLRLYRRMRYGKRA